MADNQLLAKVVERKEEKREEKRGRSSRLKNKHMSQFVAEKKGKAPGQAKVFRFQDLNLIFETN